MVSCSNPDCCVSLDNHFTALSLCLLVWAMEMRAPREASMKRHAQLMLAPSKRNILGVTVTEEVPGTRCPPPTHSPQGTKP